MRKKTTRSRDEPPTGPEKKRARTDVQCLVGVARGDHACFAEILKRYQDRVVNVVYRLVGDWDLALDLGQEAFLRIFRRAGTFRPEGNASSWIFAVAVNLARDHLRNRRNRIVYLDRVDGESPDRRRSQPTPPEVLEREEKRQQVHRVLAELPELARTMLVLRDFEGLSYQELGEILSCEVGTVKSRIHRARRQFEELFQSYQ